MRKLFLRLRLGYRHPRGEVVDHDRCRWYVEDAVSLDNMRRTLADMTGAVAPDPPMVRILGPDRQGVVSEKKGALGEHCGS
jgi:hypothetical protein